MTPDTRVLGIEGTAWAASAAVYDRATDTVEIETEAYQPDSGGIHPREAAEHMGDNSPDVVERALAHARELAADDPDCGADDPPVDCVAFSRGPGLGPCLRIVATAARAVAQRLDVPLVGVNHMVAHLEIGRHRSGFESPVCLNASGANAHVLAYRNGRYRVLGETMDTGVGNAIDKFTRHLDWSHPGGPKVEEAAEDGAYHELPYVVKGMDFSFSGVMSAAKDAVDGGPASSASGASSDPRSDGGVPVEDVCHGLQESVFAMLTEVSERALSLTGSDELVLGGGVGQNARLREMLGEMCEQRGADFFAPEARFLRDNAGMIAVLGAKMYAAGDTLSIAESGIDADFRPDQVEVSWREDESPHYRPDDADELQGAEATVEIDGDRVVKHRRPRSYRHPELDERLRVERTREEARLTAEARRHGVPTPVVLDVDPWETRLVFERVGDADLRERLTEPNVRAVGRHLATIHEAGFVHGDPTTRNVRVSLDGTDDDGRAYLIDFGLGYYTDDREDYAMDLHVLAQSLAGTADDPESLLAAAEEAYSSVGDERVLDTLRAVEGRGRYQ
ncbi:bifunctional N(6)-L-threonylcarbamoyladenine synthase/serine/threonine protein kinase [Halorientalis pallida]|uniref:Probable bifunctional tRNA threonylcarbamoyladenosine biosynthesis protein n=1 Tax=Halorientalis pallida TaxID=2479928 RepID=A0A498KWT0_9EURY|nr:bifunctional N(6)-L-threonylcarbamoyladenine synthase/serine/threonine protein kinase [Halorientalis pallida]RXK50072.1 bifunctional N(6)-L-threonylcarbamoyladenine synthase/serine/threonine protein kinase [Halorientalis pallida]